MESPSVQSVQAGEAPPQVQLTVLQQHAELKAIPPPVLKRIPAPDFQYIPHTP
jgi:hypothetical protein